MRMVFQRFFGNCRFQLDDRDVAWNIDVLAAKVQVGARSFPNVTRELMNAPWKLGRDREPSTIAG